MKAALVLSYYIILALIALGINIAVIYVIIHFVAKFW